MKIDIISDTVCPWCFIGKRKLEKALESRPDLEVEITWRPFQLHPEMPREGADRAEFIAAKFGSQERAKQLYENVKMAGDAVDIDFNFDKIKRSPNTLDSHRMLRWAESANCQDAMAEILFRRFFIDGEDLGDQQNLIAAAQEAGMDADIVRDLLESDTDLETISKEDQMAREMGISGVPFFIIDNKYSLSGAQDPAAFLATFDKIDEENKAAGES
ncbi:MAG: disulfide bond formation protein DsbA [Sneathiella sp.]|nr:MAG: disulfide bond formation protein DsbA [Sneathiella sp.]